MAVNYALMRIVRACRATHKLHRTADERNLLRARLLLCSAFKLHDTRFPEKRLGPLGA